MGTARFLRIRLLGELQLVPGGGPALPLPASKKTRALLGYLITTGQPHRRERLCDLFWDGPDDPRAELRWSLSKLRPLLDGYGAKLLADRERVSIDLGKSIVDLRSAGALLGNDVSAVSVEGLKQAATLFGGEFLDGLDLPACYVYQEWCMAEREAVSRLRLAVLAALVERLHDHPGDALVYARALTVSDSLSEAAHATVVRLLSRLGRGKEALSHYEHARRVLTKEFGAPPSDELEQARQALQAVPETRAVVEPTRAPGIPPPPSRVTRSHISSSVIGREAEHALIQRTVATTMQRQASGVLLVTGEAGIGKSHLLGCIAEHMMSAGGCAWSARAFEPEATRPYGIWLDILRAMTRARPAEGLPANLGLLLPERAEAVESGGRSRLFDAVVDFLRQIASTQPAAVILDDLQWIDEASASLLHYVARHIDASSGLLIVCAAREGEIEDNAAASRVLRSLAREERLRRIELGPLALEETLQLVRSVDAALDAARIFAQSEGHPLFTLELARAHHRGDAEPGPTIDALIAGQLAPLTDQARDVLFWAAALGRAFTPDDLGRDGHFDNAELLTALGELERRGLVRLVADDAYDFTHDLVRRATYRSVSQPRRKLLHRHIARALDAASSHDTALAADLAYHAALANDDETAARACALAGERAMRLFANADASSFAERGLRHVERLADSPAKLETRIALLKTRILAAAGPGMRPLPPLIDIVANATNSAEKRGLHAAAATGHYLLSVLHQEAGNTQLAETSTLRAAAAGRSADEKTRAHQLANTARCLLELEVDIGHARELIREGGALAGPRGLELCELHWAWGLLHRWDGENEKAVASIGCALDLAREDEDHWREYKCLTWLAVLDHELGRCSDMQARCVELKAVAARLGEDETPFVETLQALAQLAEKGPAATDALAEALHRLRTVDDKSYLAYALNSAARLHLLAGRMDQMQICAREALAAASAMRRANEITIARALLAGAGVPDPAQNARSVVTAPSDCDNLSARARSILLESEDFGRRFQRRFPR
jgi:DNA-binding SARP family transcriptional activator